MTTQQTTPNELDAAQAVLSTLGVDYRWNTRVQALQYREGMYDAWRDETDRHSADLYYRIRGQFKPSGGFSGWKTLLTALVYKTQVDPFREWIFSLDPWDGVPRLATLLSDLFTVSNNNDPGLLEWASRATVLGAVLRTLRPGEKLDEIPVLVGPQGIGKSTFVRTLVPHPDYYAEGISLTLTPKEYAEQTARKVIVEVSEMRGATSRDTGLIKNTISRQDDGYARMAYAHFSEPRPRMHVLVGTADRTEILPNDPAGNRRFVVVELERGNPGYLAWYLENNRDQIWAEALYLHRQGEHARLPDTLKPAQANTNESFRIKDHQFEDLVDGFIADQNGVLFTLEEAARGVGMIQPGETLARLGGRGTKPLTDMLNQKGWYRGEQQRVNGRVVRYWRKR